DLKVIILDEPTASITQQEADKLFEIMETLKQKGIAIIFISHRLDEVFQICDNITVLRDGNVSGQTAVKDSSIEKLVTMMVGREVVYPEKGTPVAQEGITPVLEVKKLSLPGAFKDVSFKIYPGEILGVGGLMGSGRTEIAKAIFGVYKPTGGQIFLNGKEVTINSPQKAIKSGIGMVPEDRKEGALFLNQSVRANLTFLIRKSISKLGCVVKRKELDVYTEFQKKLAIKTVSPDTYISGLSGGNQQKVIIGRWLAVRPDLLILDEPTRGIDIAAKAEVHKLMRELVKNGVCILMISSELPEVLTMANRIIVMHEGKINGILDSSEATEEIIIRKASGL
ncbi:sugar ABC transporter ATP-binding protein, partial [bacterium]|nr:sugar ABC transporter ATP-binding protein [bacterium]